MGNADLTLDSKVRVVKWLYSSVNDPLPPFHSTILPFYHSSSHPDTTDSFCPNDLAIPRNPLPLNHTIQHVFEVSNFIFGCTAGCYWYFNATVSGDSANHPCVSTPVYCNGNLDDDTDYKECTSTGSESSSISAFIEKASNTLFLRYTVNDD